MPDHRVFGVLLAAGDSQRFGKTSKLEAEFAGRTLIDRACSALAKSGVANSVVVLGPNTRQLSSSCEAFGLPWKLNPNASRGQSTSLICGLKEVHSDAEGCVFLAADQPLLEESHVDAVVSAGLQADSVARAIAVRSSSGSGPEMVGGTPSYFPQRYFDALRELSGDTGGRQLIQRLDRAQLVDVTLPEEALFDVDSAQELALLEASVSHHGFGSITP